MTLAIAFANDQLAFVATDNRVQMRPTLGVAADGSALYGAVTRQDDAIGKLELVGGGRGWLCTSGYLLGADALRPFQGSVAPWPYSIDMGGARYQQRLARLARRLSRQLDAPNPARPGGSLIGRTRLWVIGPRRRGYVLWHVDYGVGSAEDRTGTMLHNYPGDWPGDDDEIGGLWVQAFRRSLPPGRAMIYEVIRRIGACFAHVVERLGPDGSVSDDVEICLLSRPRRALWAERLPPSTPRVVAQSDDAIIQDALEPYTVPAMWGHLHMKGARA